MGGGVDVSSNQVTFPTRSLNFAHHENKLVLQSIVIEKEEHSLFTKACNSYLFDIL